MDEAYGFIRRIEVTTALVHDSQVDLANKGQVRYMAIKDTSEQKQKDMMQPWEKLREDFH